MSGEGNPPSVREQEKAALEIVTAIGYRRCFNEGGKPKTGVIVLLVGFTAVLVLFAVFVNWLWWIPAGIFIFGLVGMSFFYLMMRRQRAREEKKGV
jgi:Flp pilus assembly protein TadB